MENLCNKTFSFEELLVSTNNWGASVYLAEKLREYDQKTTGRNILLVSHELSRTGAPIAVYQFARTLKYKGDNVFLLSPKDGALRSAFAEAGIPQIIYENAFTQPMVKEWIPILDAVIVCTTAAIGMINILGGLSVPVLWWIHEANTSYHKGTMDQLPFYLPRNVKVFCGGERALVSLHLRRPEYSARMLLYSVADVMNSFESSNHLVREKYTVLSIGVQEFRKGQDILVDAFEMLDEADKRKTRIIFVGRKYYDPIWKKISSIKKRYPENIFFISELTLESLRRLELQADCIVCSSRDDPMPIVVTEMMMMSKTIIVSEYAGQAAYIKNNQCGYVYEHNDSIQLANILSNVINHPDEQGDIQKRAREVYENLFSEEVFSENAKTALEETITDCQNGITNDAVSVVIPVYNGLEDLSRLIPSLKKQKRVNLSEIIIVDSGSKDGSAEYTQKEGCIVIRIRQEEFSHSYARNLGASKAKGKYVLFMTQDALPENDTWLAKMVQPLKEGIAVAVSCCQIPRKDCDLYGKVAGHFHSEYMLFPYGDRILTAPSVWEMNSVRKNAQLDDVACAINKEVFYAFQYRGDYAEDLDLGIRLIKAGYHLSLLNSAKVIHSHTRPAFYHLRRAIVDNAIVNQLLEVSQTKWDAETIANKSITAYMLTQKYVNYVLSNSKDINIEDFKKDLCEREIYIKDEVSHMKSKERKELLGEKTPFFDDGLIRFINQLAKDARTFTYDDSLFGDVLYFAINSILDYLKNTTETITGKTKKEFSDAIVKRLGTMIGIALTCYAVNEKEDSPLSKTIHECRRGI